jgi:hypothetical protein
MSSDAEDSSTESSSNEEEERESLGAQIVKNFKRSVFDRLDFLPEGCIKTLVTESAVINCKELALTQEDMNEESNTKLLNFILKKGRKIFAILLIIGFKDKDLQRATNQFRRSKLGDSFTEETKSQVPFFGEHPKSPWEETSIRRFCNEQSAFLAPVFSSESLNLQLHAHDVLPFTGQDGDVKSGHSAKCTKLQSICPITQTPY